MISTIKLEVVPIEEDGYHLFVQGEINGRPAHLLIDTGASRTVFDKDRIIHFFDDPDIIFEKMEKLSTGLGTNTMESQKVSLKELRLGEVLLEDYEAVVLDIVHVNQSYQMLGMEPIDGVMGGDILTSLKAVINYKNKTLKLTH